MRERNLKLNCLHQQWILYKHVSESYKLQYVQLPQQVNFKALKKAMIDIAATLQEFPASFSASLLLQLLGVLQVCHNLLGPARSRLLSLFNNQTIMNYVTISEILVIFH